MTEGPTQFRVHRSYSFVLLLSDDFQGALHTGQVQARILHVQPRLFDEQEVALVGWLVDIHESFSPPDIASNMRVLTVEKIVHNCAKSFHFVGREWNIVSCRASTALLYVAACDEGQSIVRCEAFSDHAAPIKPQAQDTSSPFCRQRLSGFFECVLPVHLLRCCVLRWRCSHEHAHSSNCQPGNLLQDIWKNSITVQQIILVMAQHPVHLRNVTWKLSDPCVDEKIIPFIETEAASCSDWPLHVLDNSNLDILVSIF
mmetsp:Transcript_60242/g.123759  ORF Transcript_60242/g.123759 Transcript_60242/m.123759 type:complete len:257 (-) Transcript_60242:354-1124(-)